MPYPSPLPESERLFLRRFVAADAVDLFRFESNPELVRYIRPPVQRLEETVEKVREAIRYYDRCPGLGMFPAFGKDDGRFVGCFVIRYFAEEGKGDVEVGYGLFKEEWGKGLATEMMHQLTAYGFSVLKQPKLMAVVDPLNQPSRKVLERVGFQCTRDILHLGRLLKYYEKTSGQ
jgi:ribosomal-protein-alanine N-acetyltransferase